jgi:hypothetical protein
MPLADKGGRTSLRGPVTAGVGIVAGVFAAGAAAICKCFSPREGTSEGFDIVMTFLTAYDAAKKLLVALL